MHTLDTFKYIVSCKTFVTSQFINIFKTSIYQITKFVSIENTIK